MWPRTCSTPLRGACDQLAHFLVGALREIFVNCPTVWKYSGVIAHNASSTSSSNSRHVTGEPTGTAATIFAAPR
jgi:hypothetical protein